MLTSSVHPVPKPKPSPQPTSPLYQQVMGSEQGAWATLQWVRTHPLYQTLRAAGIVQERRLYHLIPRDRYRAYLYRYVARLVEQHQLYHHPDWEPFWKVAPSLDQAEKWAQRFHITPADARRLIQFLHDTLTEPSSNSPEAVAVQGVPYAPDIEGDEFIHLLTGFVQRHHLTEQQFTEYLLSGRWDASALVQQLGCSFEEAHQIVQILDRLPLADMMGAPVSATPPSTHQPTLLAEVIPDSGGLLCLRLVPSLAAERIVIDPVRLDEWLHQHPEAPDLPQLLSAIRLLNARAGAVVRIAHALCKHQQAYLRTGDPLELRPLSQAQLARELGYH